MRRLVPLIFLTFLLPLLASAQKPDDFSLSISLTRGERSRDSHSQTTHITLKGTELVYEKSYRGARGARSVPVKKSFQLTGEDLERLKKLVRASELPEVYQSAVAEGESGVRRYFVLVLNTTLDGKKSSIEVSGPRGAVPVGATPFKEIPAYQKANAVIDAVYKLLVERDKEIGYENRDLIDDRAQ